MEQLKIELNNKKHWEETYNKMINKQGFSKKDKDLIWKIKEIYYSDIIDELMSGNYEWSVPRKVEIAKSESKKKRVVYIYNTKDRFILGVLYRAVSARFNNEINNRCFSYKKNICTNDAIKQESGSWKWAFFAAFYTTALAWMVAFIVKQLGALI